MVVDRPTVDDTAIDSPEPLDAPQRHHTVPDSSGEHHAELPDIPSPEAYRATVDAEYRKHAIESGCARVREIEQNVITPALRRIESEDPARHLVGLENRLKSEARLSEKVENWLKADATLTNEAAFGLVKDAVRYTFQYPDRRYAEGVREDCERLKNEGFEPVDLKNSWDNEEYKGINSRWRAPESGQLFEVQFHTQASFGAKQETHAAYERIRDPATPHSEIPGLREYQRDVCAGVPIPQGAREI